MVISPLGFRICTARLASCASGGSSVSRETFGLAIVAPFSSKLAAGCGRGEGTVRRVSPIGVGPDQSDALAAPDSLFEPEGVTVGITIVGPTAKPVPVLG